MARYEYLCPNGHANYVHFPMKDPIPSTVHCHSCLTDAIRKYSIGSIQRSLQEHYNPTLGRHVTSNRDMADGLKRASEAASLATGMEHNFKPVDLRDKDFVKVTGEGLDATARHGRLSRESKTLL